MPGPESPIVVPDDIANIYVQCPAGMGAEEPPQTFAEFAKTERGEKYLDPALKNIQKLEEMGIPRDEAVEMFLGSAAVKSPEGEYVRAPVEEKPSSPDEEAKKKVALKWSPA